MKQGTGGAFFRYDGAQGEFLKYASKEPKSNPEKYWAISRILENVEFATSNPQKVFETAKEFQAGYQSQDSEFFRQLTSIERAKELQKEIGRYIYLYSQMVSR